MVQENVTRLRAYMQSIQATAVLLLQPENILYFSGFTGGEGALVVTATRAELWTDARYLEQAAQQAGLLYEIKNHQGKLASCIARTLTAEQVATVAYEPQGLTYFMYEALAQETTSSFVPADVVSLRAVKQQAEIAYTRRACAIADKAFAQTVAELHAGMTEREVATMLESKMLLLGSEEKSFTTIVASGTRSAMPHGTATDKVIEVGDFVTFDFGAVCHGYHSDMTRTLVMGRASTEQKEWYALVQEGQRLGVALLHVGASCRDIDAQVRAFFAQHGVERYFTHSLGHGTGLEIHEAPVLSPRSTETLKENMIVTVEPGLYIEGKYGVRIEDSLAITATGCELLTQTSKELMELV